MNDKNLPSANRRWVLGLAVCVILLLSGQSLFAEGDPQVWFGKIDAGAMELRVKFVIEMNEGELSGEMFSLDQDNAAIPVDSVELDGDQIEISVKKIGGSFKGKLNDDRSVAEGTWTQAGNDLPLTLKKVDEVPEEEEPTSVWRGELDVTVAKLELQLRVLENDKALFDSLTQGANGIKASIELDETTMSFKVPASAGAYEGKLNEDGTVVTGTWSQGGQEFPLEMTKVESAIDKIDVNRPQHPKVPYPYREEFVKVKNPKADCILAGTLTLPKEKGKYPSVVLISGSGPQDRDESLLGHKPFLVIADHLTRHGIAVLRFDDRGIGESTGDFGAATSLDFASDVSHLVKFLSKHNEIDPDRIGLVGHSEGGLIAPMVASKLPDKVAHVVLLAGPGVDGATILESQWRTISEDIGDAAPEEAEKRTDAMKVVQAIKDGVAEEEVEKMIKELVDAEEDDAAANALSAGLDTMTTPWFRYFIKYDPIPALKKTTCPLLALNGEKDQQVLVDLNLPAIEQALKESGNDDFRCLEMHGLNHLFQECKTGSVREYQSIEETFSRKALEEISDWVLKH